MNDKKNNLNYIHEAKNAFKNIKDIFIQLDTMGGLIIPENKYGQYLFEIPNYYGRFLTKYHTEPHLNNKKVFDWYIIQFAIKDYFDRWANSTNFEMIIHATNSNKNFFWNMNKVVRFMDEIQKMKYFNWNSYFYTIEIPFQQNNSTI